MNGVSLGMCVFPSVGVCWVHRETNERPVSHRKVRHMTNNFIGKQGAAHATGRAHAASTISPQAVLPRLGLAEENRLIERAQENAGAMAEICGRYEPLILHAAHQPHLTTVREDAESVARLALVEAVRCFDPALGIPFAAYARRKVFGDVRTFFRRERSKWQHEYVPVDTSEDELSFWDAVADPHDPMGQAELKDMLRTALSLLTDKERAVLLLLHRDLTQTQIAKILGIATQTVAKRKKTALQKMRTVLS